MTAHTQERCRLVLIAPDFGDPARIADALRKALSGGDVASVILPAYGRDEALFQRSCEACVGFLQDAGIAVMIAGDSRVAGRVRADGLHIEGGVGEIRDAIERADGKFLVGASGGKSRDDALEIGEVQPDYVFFGRIGYDAKPEAHNRNLSLGRFWSEMIQVPCVVQGGASLDSVAAVAATGADFVALSAAIFGEGVDPTDAVARANAILDDTAPRFGE